MAIALDSQLVSTPGTCGGRIRIDGTRITVHRIATLYRQGQGAEDIALIYPHLTLGQIYTALAYYHANQDQIHLALEEEDALYTRLADEAAESAEDR